MTKKTIEDRYKKLTSIEHVLLRPGRYIGSIKPHTANTWAVDEENKSIIKKELTWNPALLKMFDEVISNSVDESKKSNLDTIKITIDKDKGKITVWDNGGIPVELHKEHNQYVPEMIFGELRSGSNFDDSEDSVATGQNGEGSSLVNIFSTEFIVETADGKNKFKQKFQDNLHKRGKVQVTPNNSNYTKISFIPDYEKLETKLDDDNYNKLVKRVYDIAGCNPELKVSLNGKRIQIKSFKDYVNFYTNDFIYDTTENWNIAVGTSNSGFQHVSFVNSTETMVGGSHISYISDQITNKLRLYFQKKHKVKVKPSEIRNHLTLFIDATIINPRYSSQTKEDLITEVKDYKTSFTITDKFINKVIKSDIIHDVLEWVEAKKNAAELAELRKKNKQASKTNPNKIIKLSDATKKGERTDCELFLTEGDSAAKTIQSARDPVLQGAYPLKGKPVNVNGMDLKKLLENKEFANILVATGLQVGVKVTSPCDLRYGKIVVLADQDLDGLHIIGLCINMFYTHWREIIEMGMLYRFKTPLVKVKVKGIKESLEFFDENDFIEWQEKNKDKKYTSKYFKGLATTKTTDFKKYLENKDKYLVQLTIEDIEDELAIKLAFDSNKADDRKIWLDLEGKLNEK